LQGDFDKVKTLIDEYDKAESDTANDFEYFTDAYLHLHNLDLGTQEIKELKEQRVLQTNGEAASTVEWVIKDIQDAATENYKNGFKKIYNYSVKLRTSLMKHLPGIFPVLPYPTSCLAWSGLQPQRASVQTCAATENNAYKQNSGHQRGEI